ncbi:MAG: type IV pilin [Methanosarcinaceae archaeon]|nr:type IV pilin [Methanosarcinaceae archaeon]
MDEIKKSNKIKEIKNKRKSRYFHNSDIASSSVLSVGIMISITIILVLILSSYIFSSNIFEFENKNKNVKIDVISAKGGLVYDSPQVKFSKNIIILRHSGGPALNSENVEIVIEGFGNTYFGIPGQHGSHIVFGNITVHYKNISHLGKNESYKKKNKHINEGFWSIGETIVLSGNDSCPGTCKSSVEVLSPDVLKTSNNYGFESGKAVNLSVYENESGTRNLLTRKKVIIKSA